MNDKIWGEQIAGSSFPSMSAATKPPAAAAARQTIHWLRKEAPELDIYHAIKIFQANRICVCPFSPYV